MYRLSKKKNKMCVTSTSYADWVGRSLALFILKKSERTVARPNKHDGTDKILLLEVLGKIYDRRNSEKA